MLGISLWIGSMAWTGFIMLRTVLDPGRSEAVADTILDDDAVRRQLVANIGAGVEASLPPGAPVRRAQIDAAARTALDSPEVEQLLRAAFVDTHRAFLGEGDPPRSIDGGAFGQAARAALVDDRPELDGILPPSPTIEVPLPTERVPDLGPVRRGLEAAVPIMAGVAALGAFLSLVVTKNRPAILRRAGIWAVGLSLFVLTFAFGIPAVAAGVFPDQAEVIAALVGALAAASQGPALVLAGAGVASILTSLIWRPTTAALSAGDGSGRPIQPPRRAPQTRPKHPRQPRVRGAGPRSAARPPATDPAARASGRTRPPDAPTRVAPVVPPAGTPAGSAPTTVERAPAMGSVDGGGTDETGDGSRVLDPSQPIPADARWVPGVGYVVDER